MNNQTPESVSSCDRDASEKNDYISPGEEIKINSVTEQCNSLYKDTGKREYYSALRKLTNELCCLDVTRKGIWLERIAPKLTPITVNHFKVLIEWSGLVYLANENEPKLDNVHIKYDCRKSLGVTKDSAQLLYEFFKVVARHCPDDAFIQKCQSEHVPGEKAPSNDCHSAKKNNQKCDINDDNKNFEPESPTEVSEQDKIDKALRSCRKAKLNCAAVDCVKDKTSNLDPLVTILEEESKKNAQNIDPAKTTC